MEEQENREELAEEFADEPIAQEGVEEEADSQEPIAEGEPEEPQPIDLTQLDEFKKYQSSFDAQKDQWRREREAMEARMAELERRSAEAFLKDADPEEAVAYYQGELTKVQQQMAQQRRQQELVADVYTQLQDMGITQDEINMLDWPDEISERGALQVIKSAAKLQMQRLSHTKEEVEKEAKAMAREERQKAIKETGAARTSADGGPSSKPSLAAEYAREYAKLKGTNDVLAVVELKNKYRQLGLDV